MTNCLNCWRNKSSLSVHRVHQRSTDWDGMIFGYEPAKKYFLGKNGWLERKFEYPNHKPDCQLIQKIIHQYLFQMELNCRFVAHQDDWGVAFEQEFHQRPHDYSNLLISGHYFIIKITFDNLIVFRFRRFNSRAIFRF